MVCLGRPCGVDFFLAKVWIEVSLGSPLSRFKYGMRTALLVGECTLLLGFCWSRDFGEKIGQKTIQGFLKISP